MILNPYFICMLLVDFASLAPCPNIKLALDITCSEYIYINFYLKSIINDNYFGKIINNSAQIFIIQGVH